MNVIVELVATTDGEVITSALGDVSKEGDLVERAYKRFRDNNPGKSLLDGSNEINYTIRLRVD